MLLDARGEPAYGGYWIGRLHVALGFEDVLASSSRSAKAPLSRGLHTPGHGSPLNYISQDKMSVFAWAA
jgi:hypothetical protein